MTYRIILDPSLCSGFGACVDADPESFALADDGIAVALTERTTRTAALEAARSCPMGAIRIVDDAGDQAA